MSDRGENRLTAALTLRTPPALALCLVVVLSALAEPAAAQRKSTIPSRNEEIWQKQYDDLLAELEKADGEYLNVKGRLDELVARKAPEANVKKVKAELGAVKKSRIEVLRDIENFLRRSGLRRRPLMADLYVQRSAAATSELERVANLDQAEAVLRDAVEYFAAQGKPEANNPDQFNMRVLCIRARRALADLLVDHVVYPALDEYEIFNNPNQTVRTTASAIGEAINLYRRNREDFEDLVSDARDQVQRIQIAAQLDGFSAGMKVSMAWQSYYRAWLTPAEPATAEQRKRDLDFAYDAFQELSTNREAPDIVKAQARLGMAVVERERGNTSGAVGLLNELAGSPQLTGVKVQSTWELARTYGVLRQYDQGVRTCDKLIDLENQYQKGAEDTPGRFYTQFAPAMKLQLLYEWKNSSAPGKADAEKKFDAEAKRLAALGFPWNQLVESFVSKTIRKLIKNPEAPTADELANPQLAAGTKLSLARKYLDAGEYEKCLPYFMSLVGDKGWVGRKDNAEQVGEVFFELGSMYYQMHGRDVAKLASGEKPDPKHLLESMSWFKRLTKELPGTEKAKLVDKERIVAALVVEVEKAVGKEEAAKLLGDGKLEAILAMIKNAPDDPKVDGLRLAAASEAERLAASKTGKEKGDLLKVVLDQLGAIKPGKPDYMYARLHSAEILVLQYFEAEPVIKVEPRSLSKTMVEAAEVALSGGKDFKPEPTLEQQKSWRSAAANFVIGAAEILTRPPLGDTASAVKLIEQYDKKFDGETRKDNWDTEALRVRRMLLQFAAYQNTGQTAKADAVLNEFLDPAKISAERADRYLMRLFNQTKRLITVKELEASKARTAADQKKLVDQSIDLAKQLIILGNKLMDRMTPQEKAGPRGLDMRILLIEMKIKSGEEKAITDARAEVEKLLETDKENGHYQILKCESLTKLAVLTDKNEDWTLAGSEWAKLTQDPKMRENPEYRDFYWQAWYNRLGVRLEQAKNTPKFYDEVANARKNLQGLYGEPTELWKPFFDELDRIIAERGSVYRK